LKNENKILYNLKKKKKKKKKKKLSWATKHFLEDPNFSFWFVFLQFIGNKNLKREMEKEK
jgi:hypothetical protein